MSKVGRAWGKMRKLSGVIAICAACVGGVSDGARAQTALLDASPPGAAEAAITIKAGEVLDRPAPDQPLEQLEILIDERLLQGLARIEDGRLLIEPPFETAGRHRLVIRTTAGETLTDLVFRIDKPSLLDQIETRYAAAITHTTTKVRESTTSPVSSDDVVDTTADASALWRSGRWRIEGAANGIAAESDSRSPFETVRGDVQNTKLAIGFADETAGYALGLRAGDVDVSGANSFVSSGFSGRGLASTFSLFEDRLRLDLGAVSGVSVIGLRDGARTPESGDFRIGGDLAFDLLRDGPLTATLGATGLVAERPLSFGFGASGVDNNEDNRALGLSLGLGAFEDRLRYEGKAARSLFANPITTASGQAVRDLFAGNLHDHALALDILSDEQTLSANFGYQHVDPLYQAIEGYATADLETFLAAATGSAFGADLSVNASLTRDNVERVANQLRSEVLSLDAALSYAFDAESFGPAFPESVSVTWSRIATDPLDGARYLSATGLDASNLSRNTQRSYGVDLSWSYPLGALSAGSTIGYARAIYDERTATLEAADTEDDSITLSQSLSGDWWSVSGSTALAFGRQFDPSTDGKSYGVDWTLDASLAPSDLPSIDLSLAFGRQTSEQRAFLSRQSARSLSASVNIGLQPWLSALGFPDALTSTFSYQRSRSASDSDGFSSDDVDERFILSFGGAL